MKILSDTREELIARVELGQSILQKFMDLSDKEIKEKLKEILESDSKSMEVLNNDPSITRIIKNENPYEIRLSFYNGLILDWSGIFYAPEHGETIPLRKFDKFFNFS